MRILGIDPGSHRVGYAILEKPASLKSKIPQVIQYGTIDIQPKTPTPENLIHIYEELKSLIQETKPNLACIEELFFMKNKKTASKVYEARGVILLCLGHCQIPYYQLTAKQIKKGISASGNATKKDIRSSIQKILGFQPSGQDDSWDAIACAFVGFSIPSSIYLHNH